MTIFYRVILLFLILAGGYTLYGIGHFHLMYHRVENPREDFLVMGNSDSETTIVEYLNYTCGYCKNLHPVIKGVLEARPDLRYVARPIAYGEPDESSFRTIEIALAAGLQGKFLEFHEAFLEYPEPDIPDDFIEELCSLYGISYDQLIADSQGKDVARLVKENLSVSNHAAIFSVPTIQIGKTLYVPPEEGVADVREMLEIIKQAESQ